MKNKGFTLIEVLLMIIVLSSITVYVMNFLFHYNNFVWKIEDNVDIQENMKIAMDFLYDSIVKAGSINIENNSIYIDGKKFYIKNNILRYDTDSQQIASGITKIEIIKISDNQNLYFIKIYSNNKIETTYVLNRSDVYD
ncbi:PilW family protein [Caloramator quimbayensis]|uniref:PilW family protein n=1 Tax=Caloramator quimbayensis TaxID=1147123 RepID=UPI00099A5CB2|nr:type II secretion system protein [Caloramator quimbayensis]